MNEKIPDFSSFLQIPRASGVGVSSAALRRRVRQRVERPQSAGYANHHADLSAAKCDAE